MTEQKKKPHIRIHYATPERDGCVNGQCLGDTFGCHRLSHKEDDTGYSEPVCCNTRQVGQPSTWFEHVSGDLPNGNL